MAAEYLKLTISDGSTDYTFNKTNQNGSKSIFSYNANTVTDRRFVEVDHAMAATGSKATDIHSIVVKHEAVDADTERVSVSKVSLQIHVPKGDAITAAHILNDVSLMMCLFKKAFMDGFINGETQTGDYDVTGPFNPVRA